MIPVCTLFTFHPVGQGCFYSGQLNFFSKNMEQFNFVYDCGSNSSNKLFSLSKVIKNYKQTIKNKHIDLLVISHFDNDHVNGIKKLIKDISVEHLIIPYYNVYERLILTLNKPSYDKNNLDIILDPYRYFLKNKNINNVHILTDDENVQIDSYVGYTDNDNEIFELKINNIEVANDDLSNELKKIKKINSKVRVHKSKIRARIGIWEFYFYNLHKYNDNFDNKIDSFKNKMDNFIKQLSDNHKYLISRNHKVNTSILKNHFKGIQ